jgi:hypothetical protein
MRKFDETYERLIEQHRLDESFLGTLGNLAMKPLKVLGAIGKAYGKAIFDPIKNSKIGQAFGSEEEKKPSEKLKGVMGLLSEIIPILDKTEKHSTKKFKFKNLSASKEELFSINDFYLKGKKLGTKEDMMNFAKETVSTMDFSSLVDSKQNLIKSSIKEVIASKEWKQENPNVKIDENETIKQIKNILKSEISRANTKVKFNDKLTWLYLLAPSTHQIQK